MTMLAASPAGCVVRGAKLSGDSKPILGGAVLAQEKNTGVAAEGGPAPRGRTDFFGLRRYTLPTPRGVRAASSRVALRNTASHGWTMSEVPARFALERRLEEDRP